MSAFRMKPGALPGGAGGSADGGGGGARRRALSAPHAAPITGCSVWEDGIILPGASREYARAEGMRFPDALITNLKGARVGPARAALCAARRAEAREALREAEQTLNAAEEAIEQGEGFSPLVPGLRETHWLCSGLGHALEILEANSRACGEGVEVMVEYQSLILQAGNCEWRLSRLAERWRETEGKEFSFGKFMSFMTTPFAGFFQNLMPSVGLVSDSPNRHRAQEAHDEVCSVSSGRQDTDGVPDAPGDADAGAGGGGHSSTAKTSAPEAPIGAWMLWGGAGWGAAGVASNGGAGSTCSSAREPTAEEVCGERPPPESIVSPRDTRSRSSRAPPAQPAQPAQPGRAQVPVQVPVQAPERMSELEADLANLKLEMERRAMQAEDAAARSREMQAALMRQVEEARVENRHAHQQGAREAPSEGAAPTVEEEFYDAGDE